MDSWWRAVTMLLAVVAGVAAGLRAEDPLHRRFVDLVGRSLARAALVVTAYVVVVVAVMVGATVLSDALPARPVLPVLVVAMGVGASAALAWPLVSPSAPDAPGPRAVDRRLTRFDAVPRVAAVAEGLGVVAGVLVVLPVTMLVAWYAFVLE